MVGCFDDNVVVTDENNRSITLTYVDDVENDKII